MILDGRRLAIVSQHATHRPWSAASSGPRAGLPHVTHNLTIRAPSDRRAARYGPRTDVDAFLVGGSAVKAYPPPPFKYPWPTYLVVDKSEYKLYWVKDGVLVKNSPIAHGKASTPTPSRVWRIDQKYRTDPSERIRAAQDAHVPAGRCLR